jgi:hypothetical protein
MLILSEHREPKDLSSLLPFRAQPDSPLLSCKQIVPLTPLAATLMEFPASVANKRLTIELTPLAATLTKNIGGGASACYQPLTLSFVFLHLRIANLATPLF